METDQILWILEELHDLAETLLPLDRDRLAAIKQQIEARRNQMADRCEGCGEASLSLRADAGDNLLCPQCSAL